MLQQGCGNFVVAEGLHRAVSEGEGGLNNSQAVVFPHSPYIHAL